MNSSVLTHSLVFSFFSPQFCFCSSASHMKTFFFSSFFHTPRFDKRWGFKQRPEHVFKTIYCCSTKHWNVGFHSPFLGQSCPSEPGNGLWSSLWVSLVSPVLWKGIHPFLCNLPICCFHCKLDPAPPCTWTSRKSAKANSRRCLKPWWQLLIKNSLLVFSENATPVNVKSHWTGIELGIARSALHTLQRTPGWPLAIV